MQPPTLCLSNQVPLSPQQNSQSCYSLDKPDAFPSSTAFDAINTALQSSPAERTDAVKKGNAIFAFNLKNGSGEIGSWYIDLKEKGEVVKGEPKKADVTLNLSDEDFGKMVAGKTQAQRLFMSGKLKIKGDVMKVGLECFLLLDIVFGCLGLTVKCRQRRWSRY